mmetsp:Transcript_29650/g.71741  ORF Transcript_29650/g.71741 Transcript_29650/m.71741 type:complete len:512 (-) Transcript_29650:66-1601(-)
MDMTSSFLDSDDDNNNRSSSVTPSPSPPPPRSSSSIPRPSLPDKMTRKRRKRNRSNIDVRRRTKTKGASTLMAVFATNFPTTMILLLVILYSSYYGVIVAAAAVAASMETSDEEPLECHVDGNHNDDHPDYHVDHNSSNNVTWDITSDQTIYRCNIKRYTWSQFQSKFISRSSSSMSNDDIGGSDSDSDMHDLHHLLPLLYPHPLVIVNDDEGKNDNFSGNKYFRKMVDRHKIVEFFPPGFNVTLSSSNSFSEHRRTIPLQTYIQEIITNSSSTTPTRSSTVSPDTRSNETWYLFGETYSDEWKRLLRHYELPPCQACIRDNTYDDYDDDNGDESQSQTTLPTHGSAALSFGIGGKGSGVQWHVHGPGWSESLAGRKHWVLYEPNKKPEFDPDQTSYHWMYYEYPKILMSSSNNSSSRPLHKQQTQNQKQRKTTTTTTTTLMTEKKTIDQDDNHNNIDDVGPLPSPLPWECTLNPGDLIYFPDMWWHATINLDEYTAFISTFTQDHLLLQQ